MATKTVTEEVTFPAYMAAKEHMFAVRAGVSREDAEAMATYLLSFMRERTFDFGDTKPALEEMTVHHFLHNVVHALRTATGSIE